MSADWAAQISLGAVLWATRIGHAAAYGSALSLLAWLLCHPRVRLAAATRCWLWWLVCLKMTFDLCGAASLPLPILPTRPAATATLPAPAIITASPGKPFFASKTAAAPTLSADDVDAPRGHSFRQPLSHAPWVWLQFFWLWGVLWGIGRLAGQALAMRRTVRKSLPMDDALLRSEASHLAARLGLKRTPALHQTLRVAAPCITGFFRPVILLPVGLSQTLSCDELRLALAHEMAHLRRGDLWLSALPTLTRLLFFFFPPAWLAGSEWANAREEACDALALRITEAAPAHYGRLLLKVASGAGKSVPLAALSMASAYPALKRRLLGLQNSPGELSRWARCFPALALPLLLPWRLVPISQPLKLMADVPAMTQYQVVDLGTLGGSSGEAVSLNNSGQVVGQARLLPGSPRAHGFLWSAGHLIALTSQRYSQANGINDNGQIILAAYSAPGHPRSLVWDGVRHKLGALPGYPYTEARGINDSGQVVGYALTGDHDRWQALVGRAVLWDTGQTTDLGTLGGAYSDAYGINNAGTVVGKADTETFGQTHAFLWSGGAMQDLGTLGGANSLATHVNEADQVVGSAETGAGNTRHAFLWQDGQMRDLGVLPGTVRSAAYDINNAGQVVGQSDQRAFLWQNGHLTDLNALLPAHSGWVLEDARAINDKGQIVGSGTIHGQTHAFLLTPK